MGAREQYLDAMLKLDLEQIELDQDKAVYDEFVHKPLIGGITALTARQKSIDTRRRRIKDKQTALAQRGSGWRLGREMKQAAANNLLAEIKMFKEERQKALDSLAPGSDINSRMVQISKFTNILDKKEQQLRIAQDRLQKHLDNKPPNIYAQLPEELAVLEHINGVVVPRDNPTALDPLMRHILSRIENPELLQEDLKPHPDTDVSAVYVPAEDMPINAGEFELKIKEETDESANEPTSESTEENSDWRG